jgi:hypothetical protein
MAKRKRAAAKEAVSDADLILETTQEATLLDMIDRLLDKGVVVNGDVVLGVAGVDLVYLRLATLLSAIDRIFPARPARSAGTIAGRAGCGRRDMTRRTRKTSRRSKGTKPRKKSRSTPKKKPAVIRWNPDADDVQRSVIKLVLTLIELIRKLMERQAIRRMDEKTMTEAETEAVGIALMEIERTVREIGSRFDLTPEDLNLDLGSIKLL